MFVWLFASDRLYMWSDFAGPHHKNTDGFNPSSSSDISLTDSYIHNGDDCIAVKSGKQPAAWSCDIPSENILIKNVTCAGSHGLTIGSEVAGGIRNVTFLNVRIHGADGHPSSGAIKFKLPCGRGAYVQDIIYENITASDVASGIMLAGTGASCSINGTTVVSNVTIRNVRAEKIAGPAFAIDGYSVEGRPASYTPFSVRLDNVTMVDYAQIGSCTHATVQTSDVNPAVPTKDASCVVSGFSKSGLPAVKTDDLPDDEVQPVFGHSLRSKWFFRENYTQLNHGSYGACPRSVMNKQFAYLQQMETNMERWMNNAACDPVDCSIQAGWSFSALVNRSRTALAKYINASMEDVVLVDNASNAINALLRSLPLKEGDILISFSVAYQPFEEFYTWLEATKGVKVVQVPMTWPLRHKSQVIDAFKKTLQASQASGGHVAYVVASHVSSYPAILMPVAELSEIAHAHGVQIIVDGAHALGNFPVDIGSMSDVDYRFGNGHKWLFSPKASALLYVRKDHQQWICPFANMTCRPRATVIDSVSESFVTSFTWEGTRDRSAFASMYDALQFRESIGGDAAIMGYNAELAGWGAHYLSRRWNTTNFLGDDFFTSMSNVVLPSSNGTAMQLVFASLLSEYGLNPSGRGSCANANAEPGILPGQAGCHFFRLSAQIYLEKQDIVRLGDAVVALLQRFDPGFGSHFVPSSAQDKPEDPERR